MLFLFSYFVLPVEHLVVLGAGPGGQCLDGVESGLLIAGPDLDPPHLAVAVDVLRLHAAGVVLAVCPVSQLGPRLAVIVHLGLHGELNRERDLPPVGRVPVHESVEVVVHVVVVVAEKVSAGSSRLAAHASNASRVLGAAGGSLALAVAIVFINLLTKSKKISRISFFQFV